MEVENETIDIDATEGPTQNERIFHGRDGKEKQDESESNPRGRANTVEDNEGKPNHPLSIDNEIGKNIMNIDKNST